MAFFMYRQISIEPRLKATLIGVDTADELEPCTLGSAALVKDRKQRPCAVLGRQPAVQQTPLRQRYLRIWYILRTCIYTCSLYKCTVAGSSSDATVVVELTFRLASAGCQPPTLGASPCQGSASAYRCLAEERITLPAAELLDMENTMKFPFVSCFGCKEGQRC